MQRLIYGVPRPDMSSQNTIFSIFHFYETSEQQPMIKLQGEKIYTYAFNSSLDLYIYIGVSKILSCFWKKSHAHQGYIYLIIKE